MIIDCFPFFNEKELLELRINLLKDKVDKFIISELNYTHSGIPKPFLCKQLIVELGLPSDKIEVIELELPENENLLSIEEIDQHNSSAARSPKEVFAWVRERLQRDALLHKIEEYPEDTVFIVSDCDEMVNPDALDYIANVTKNANSIIKIPLILLEGRADRRLYTLDGAVAPWDCSLFTCTKSHLMQVTPTQIRSNYLNHFGFVRLYENNVILEDLGWHFTWMGDAARKKQKSEAYIHYANLEVLDNISHESMSEIGKSFDAKYTTHPFPRNKLPEVLFKLPRVLDFLLKENDEPREMKPIPLMGTLIVNGVHWLDRLMKTIDYPVDEFVIFNNNGRGEIDKDLDNLAAGEHKYIKKIKVCHLPRNLGCPGGWNLIIKSYIMSSYWIITSHDVAFSPGFLEDMVKRAEVPEVGIVNCSDGGTGLGSFECFLIKDWVVQSHGLFDENFYPGYTEDLDYKMRMIAKPVKRDFVQLPYLHGEEDYATSGSQTWRVEPLLEEKLTYARLLNEGEYFDSKWGNWRDLRPYPTPFNNPSYPLSFSKFDLNFVRKKYLGF